MKPDGVIDDKNFTSFVSWFEENYSPGKKENGRYSMAEITLKGIKGNINIQIMYQDDVDALREQYKK